MEEQKPADEGDIKTPVKKLAKELTQKYVQKMVKEATKKALEKQHENIDNKKFKRLQDKLGRSSEQEKIDYFTESVDKVSSEIPDIKDKDLIEHISREFGKNATKHTSRLLLTLPSVTKIVVIVIALIAVYMLGGVPNGDTGTQLEASINYITPNPAIEGENIIFSGSGTTSDSEEYITSYRWESDQYGFLSSYETFETTLPPGNYVITFRVRNNHGEWSKPDETHIEILPVVSENRPPTAHIDYISPTPPVYKGTNIAFEGHGEDPDNDEITEYEWRLDSQLLSKSGKFTTDNLQAGTHIVTFRVKDSNNEWSNPEEVFIEILQATSNKQQATSNKQQATSNKQQPLPSHTYPNPILTPQYTITHLFCLRGMEKTLMATIS